MKNTLSTGFLAVLLSVGVFITVPQRARAADECTCPADQASDQLACNKTKRACWEDKINQKKQAANTLSNTISILNGQIVIQQLQINQTKLEIDQLEKDISDLSERISGLNVSLDSLGGVLIQRIVANYKYHQINPVNELLISDSITSFLTKYKYLQATQKYTQELMKKSESQRISFDQQKALKEKKQQEVDKKKQTLIQQQADLDRQRVAQQTLLQQTRNDEARYQQELAKTLAEQQAIESLIAGNGDEQKVRDVQQGEVIASIIPGPSPCSNGAHLHFEVVKDGLNLDPSNYLKSIPDLIWNNDPDGPFGFSGNWEWPLPNAARINQGFGMTFYARVRRAYGGAPHTGIDMDNKDTGDYTVRAVKPGTLYRGSIRCGGGRLRYVKVDHHDNGISSYYLHVNY